ncbi:MAG: glycosyltransferase family 2 protein [Chitinophagaceae bacterium]|nr:MAG: glycosyltransferase family 2 protein [Chitinophagaceae bacterium]
MDLSIVIPTYNSELYIQQTLKHLIQLPLLISEKVEIIIVDDGSTDKTEEVVKEFISGYLNVFRYVKSRKNRGQKASIFTGLKLSKGKYAMTLDDDLQYSNDDIESLYEKIKNSDFWVVGSKTNFKTSKKYEFLRKVVFFIFGLFFRKYIDTGYFSAFKIYDLEKLRANSINNIFFFWQIPADKMDVIYIEKKKGIRTYSNYNFVNFLKLTSTILLRAVLLFSIYLGLPLSLLILFLFDKCFILIVFVSLIIISLTLLQIEKIQYAKLAQQYN